MAKTIQQTVQEFYVAYYGRPADPDGLDFWTKKLSTTGAEFDEIVGFFANSPEAQEIYDFSDPENLVRSIYLNILGREPDAQGLDWYVGKIASGEYTVLAILQHVLDGAQPGSTDRKVIDELIGVAEQFTQMLREDSDLKDAYVGSEVAARVREFMKDLAVSKALNPDTVGQASPSAHDATTSLDSLLDLIVVDQSTTTSTATTSTATTTSTTSTPTTTSTTSTSTTTTSESSPSTSTATTTSTTSTPTTTSTTSTSTTTTSNSTPEVSTASEEIAETETVEATSDYTTDDTTVSESPPVDFIISYSTPTKVDTFQPVQADHYRTPLSELHVTDLNNDGIEEVFWSNVSWDWSGENWHNSSVQIFGFNNGEFTNETMTWFEPGDNEYVGGFRINFGDFDADGYQDAFLAAFTDTPNYSGPSVMLLNSGTSFERVEFDTRSSVAHDSTVYDINQDGIDDVILTGTSVVLGNAQRDFEMLQTPEGFGIGTANGAGISVADYLGDGTVTVIITDGPGQTPEQDTVLMRPILQENQLWMENITALPADRFFQDEWTATRESTDLSPHAVRNLAVDFNHDGLQDVVVFSSMPLENNVHGVTEIQFLENQGQAEFVDVTDEIMPEFDHERTVSYNPVLTDVNRDGHSDILMSATDYTDQPSTSILLGQSDGTFAEHGRAEFDQFHDDIMAQTGAGATQAQPVTLVQGPDDATYLVSGVAKEIPGAAAEIDVYISELLMAPALVGVNMQEMVV